MENSKKKEKILKEFWNKFDKDMIDMFLKNIKPCLDKLKVELKKQKNVNKKLQT